jgi:transposase InsO family protein
MFNTTLWTIIRSDEGSHFANESIAQFLVATGTLQNLTLANSSQENAIVERNYNFFFDTYVCLHFIPIQLTTINLIHHLYTEL